MFQRESEIMDNEFTFPDGSKGWFELRIHPVPKGIFILSIDITERKKAEQQRLDHIDALEEMIFMTSHKVRQPITNILGVSHMLDLPDYSQDELHQIASHMRQAILSLDAFTQELTHLIHDVKLRAKTIHAL